MHITQFTDIGLRVLMYLTQHQRESLITIAELAEQFQLSHNHLIKVVNQMVKLGWVEATRGRNGGLKLGIAPHQLHLGMIIRSLENEKQLIDCDKAACALDGNCRLKGILAQGLTQFHQWLDQYTLADMVRDPTQTVLVQMHQRWVTG
ncbi:Rrf2 family transcriptional regulator [Thiothrix lacustris]|uniref:Rrf2 family transcriptional regulator n=1 Tax=Thiothrix lacustris TaxID=525917 RepID=A0ABY9MVB6_9GAMM|nr:Rrf2 family transcriptional regulator [Thiothrix lacustris]WML92130.1 Rrf2 family transcriptional regulator [Thiothrix lacustris]